MGSELTENQVRDALPGATVVERLPGYHNDVVVVELDARRLVLRVAPPGHRSESELRAEMLFLRHLADDEAPVVRPAPRPEGDLIVRIPGAQPRLGCLFELVDGTGWRECEHDRGVIEAAGEALGRIHASSRSLRAARAPLARRAWHEKPHLVRAAEVCDRIASGLGTSITRFVDELRRHDGPGDGWGLLHGDFLFSNYLVRDDAVCVIDFDDCEYGHYAYDLAVNVYYYVLGGDPAGAEHRTDRARELLDWLLRGYRRHQPFSRVDAELLEPLMVQREIDLLSSIATHFDTANLGPWQRAFVDSAVPRVLEHRPVVRVAHVARDS